MERNNGSIETGEKQKNFNFIAYPIIITIAIAFFYSIPGILLEQSVGKDAITSWKPYILAFSQVFFMLIPAIIAAKYVPLPEGALLKLRGKITPQMILFAIVGLVGLRFFAAGYLSLQDMIVPDSLRNAYEEIYKAIDELYSQYLRSDSFGALLQSLMIGALVPAICEETLFRGFLQNSLAQRLKTGTAIVITGVLFAVLHMNIIEFIPLVVIGIFLGYSAGISGGLLLPMIIHLLNNAAAIFILYIADKQGIGDEYDIMPPYAAGFALLIGILLIWYSIYSMKRYQNSTSA